jgi:hypothetical protein
MKALGNLGAVAKTATVALQKAHQEDRRESNRTAAAVALRNIRQAVQNMK